MGLITNSFRLSGDTYSSTIITGITSGDATLTTNDGNLVTERAVKYYVDNSTAGSSSLSTAISTEASTRGTADTSLSTAVSTRISVDGSLSTSISTESSTRGSVDTSLSTALSTRVSVDTSLSTAISTEASTRTTADISLSTAIASVGGVTIISNTNNYILTASGTANTINGEANLQFNPSTNILTVTGTARVAAGSSTTPSLSFTTDTNTGFFLPTTDNIGVSINGTERFRFDSSSAFHSDGDIIAYSSTLSDIRLKNINSYLDDENVLDIIKNLKTIKYEWKHKKDGVHIGFIAQDMEKYVPEIVVEHNILSTKNDELYKTIRYSEFIPYLTAAIKKQQEIIDKQQKEIDDLKKIINK